MKNKKDSHAIWRTTIILSIILCILSSITSSTALESFGLILFVVSIFGYRNAKKQANATLSVQQTSFPQPEEGVIHTDSRSVENTDTIAATTNQPVVPQNKPAINPSKSATRKNKSISSQNHKTERHHITGTSHYLNNIMKLASENHEYSLSKKEMIDEMLEDQRIYEYNFFVKNVELLEEPTNPYDPNAIKVIIDGIHVGYIKKGSCSHVKNLISQNKILDISAEITGGRYKYLSCEYDYEKDKDVYTLEKDEKNFYVDVEITLK